MSTREKLKEIQQTLIDKRNDLDSIIKSSSDNNIDCIRLKGKIQGINFAIEELRRAIQDDFNS